jgi:hypothetical protein
MSYCRRRRAFRKAGLPLRSGRHQKDLNLDSSTLLVSFVKRGGNRAAPTERESLAPCLRLLREQASFARLSWPHQSFGPPEYPNNRERDSPRPSKTARLPRRNRIRRPRIRNGNGRHQSLGQEKRGRGSLSPRQHPEVLKSLAKVIDGHKPRILDHHSGLHLKTATASL